MIFFRILWNLTKLIWTVISGVLGLIFLTAWLSFKLCLGLVLILVIGIWFGNSDKIIYALNINKAPRIVSK